MTPAVGGVGGTERALSWLTSDIVADSELTVITGQVPAWAGRSARTVRLPMVKRPRLLKYVSFLASNTVYFAVRRLMRRPRGVVVATGGDCYYADVIYAHFCVAAYRRVLKTGLVTLPSVGWRMRLRNLHYHMFLLAAERVERTIYRSPRLRGVIAVAQGTADEIAREYGYPRASIHVVPNAVDPKVILSDADRARARAARRQQLGLAEATVVVLFVAASDWKRKGLEILLRALADSADISTHLVAVGEEDILHYEALAEQMGLNQRVHFPGFQAELADWYAAADVFAYPSAFEAFSLVTLEAAGAGLPLIVSETSGTAELVESGVNGFVVEREPGDIARAIDRLAADPALRQRMGAAARARSRAFSRGATAERFLSTCRTLAGVQNPR